MRGHAQRDGRLVEMYLFATLVYFIISLFKKAVAGEYERA